MLKIKSVQDFCEGKSREELIQIIGRQNNDINTQSIMIGELAEGFQAPSAENGSLTKREYYAAHAPSIPPWFMIKVESEHPKRPQKVVSDEDMIDFKNKKLEWSFSMNSQILREWKLYYSKLMCELFDGSEVK